MVGKLWSNRFQKILNFKRPYLPNRLANFGGVFSYKSHLIPSFQKYKFHVPKLHQSKWHFFWLISFKCKFDQCLTFWYKHFSTIWPIGTAQKSHLKHVCKFNYAVHEAILQLVWNLDKSTISPCHPYLHLSHALYSSKQSS